MDKIEKLYRLKEYYELVINYNLFSENMEKEIIKETERLNNIINYNKTKINSLINHPKFNNILKNICYLHNEYISLENDILVHKNKEINRDVFDKSNFTEVVEKNVLILQTSIKKIVNNENIDSSTESLYKSYITLKEIFNKLENIKKDLLNNLGDNKTKELNEIKGKIKNYENLYPFVIEKKEIDSLLNNQIILSCLEKFKKKDYQNRSILPIGYIETKIPEQIKEFVNKEFNFTLNNICEEVSLSFNHNHNNLFINIDDDEEEAYSNKYLYLFYNIIFSYLSEFELTKGKLVFVEDISKISILSSIEKNLNKINSNFMYDSVKQTKEDTLKLIKDIKNLISLRNAEMLSMMCNNINEYNTNYPSKAMDYLLLVINGYDMIAHDKFLYNEFLKLLENKTSSNAGLMIVILGKNADYKVGYEFNPQLDLENLGIREIHFKNDKMIFNNNELNTTYLTRDFSVNKQLFKELMDALDDKTKHVLKKINKNKIVNIRSVLEYETDIPVEKKVSIPIAKSDERVYKLEMSTRTTSLLPYTFVSGMSGSGKTAFINMLILSSAMKYTPDEFQIYLLDFKSEKTSISYNDYKYIEDEENLYIPHIKYLSTQAKSENASGVLDLISNMIDERSLLGNFKKYNESEEVKTGKKKKMPFVLFIIDEFYKMFHSGDKNDNASLIRISLKENIKSILKRAREFGIGIIFSSQSPSDIPSEVLEDINFRIGFYHGENDKFISLFPKARLNMFNKFPKISMTAIDDESLQTVAGYAFYGNSNSEEPIFIRMAYVSEEDKYALAKEIRDKYKNYPTNQIIIGSLSNIKLNNENKYMTWDKYVKQNIELETINKPEIRYDSKQREEEQEKYEKRKPLVIGYSETSLLPASIDFTMQNDRNNYYAYAKQDVLYAIERNSAVAYVYQILNENENNKCVVYCGSKECYEKCFSKLFEVVPFIKNYITNINNEIEMIDYLLEIDNSNIENKYIIIHDLEWTTKENLDEIVKNSNKEIDDSTNNSSNSNDNKIEKNEAIRALEKAYQEGIIDQNRYERLISKKINDIEKANEKLIKDCIKKKDKKINKDQIYKALESLYMEKNTKGIFMLLSSDRHKHIEGLTNRFISNNSNKKELILTRSIYGTYNQVNNPVDDENSSESYCYLLSSNINVRLIDYLESKEWLDELTKLYLNKKR